MSIPYVVVITIHKYKCSNATHSVCLCRCPLHADKWLLACFFTCTNHTGLKIFIEI